MALHLAYAAGWRLQADIYWHSAGSAELSRQQRRLQVRHLFHLVVALGSAILALRLRLWILLGAFMLVATRKAVQPALSFGLARHAAFVLPPRVLSSPQAQRRVARR